MSSKSLMQFYLCILKDASCSISGYFGWRITLTGSVLLTCSVRNSESDRNDPSLVHVFRPIAELGLRVLRVIYNETNDPVTIGTAYFDDEVKDL